MYVARTQSDLAGHRDRTGPLVLVPTMGALHAGHASLIEQAAELARVRGWAGGAVATIFVNPTQFNNPADLARYPRSLEADLEHCRVAGAAAVFVPEPQTVYPPGEAILVPALPEVATRPRLEDLYRPGHFAGVAQVVRRLFDLTAPIAAIFGEKDWQQLRVIAAMTARDQPHIEIIPGPTIREPDGLAMSSRNVFLAPADRPRALAISAALRAAASKRDPAQAERALREVLAAAGIEPEYAVVRDRDSLEPFALSRPAGPGFGRGLIAAVLGGVRLIDNAAWPD